jgi:nonribosomal peptide synthetase protein BlmVIII
MAEARLRPEFVGPGTVAERTLAELRREVLGTHRVKIHYNFFGLGGDSLVAARLTARINERFELEVSVASIFRFPTIYGQGILVETKLLDEIERVDS